MKSLDEQAKYILSLKDDWDDEGAKAYSKETVDTALQFIRKTIDAYKGAAHLSLDRHDIIPVMAPGPDGSIDLDWEYCGREILLNIDRVLASFYGDNYNGDTIKGTLDIDKGAAWLIFWLIQ